MLLIAALCLGTGLLTILALLEFHDNAQEQAVDRLDKVHKSRIAGLNEQRLETKRRIETKWLPRSPVRPLTTN